MEHFSKQSLEQLPARHRANLINTISGYKSANLIATRSPQGSTNLAIFNSMIHLGSNPALLGFMLRPLTVQRHTYENLKASSQYTINAITQEMYREAHHTSAKYAENESEFSMTSFTESYRDGFSAPYVQQSPIQIGCRYVNEYEIKENGCVLVVGALEHVYVAPGLLHDDQWAQLDKAKIMSVTGIDGYALPELQDRLAYARPNQSPKSILDGPQEG